MASLTRTLTLRLPEEEHNALRLFAFVTGISMNEAIVRATREFLLSQEGEVFDKALDRFRADYRVALDKLADQ